MAEPESAPKGPEGWLSWWTRLREWWHCLPCVRFRPNAEGSVGCKCGWNLAAHTGDPRYAEMIARDLAEFDDAD